MSNGPPIPAPSVPAPSVPAPPVAARPRHLDLRVEVVTTAERLEQLGADWCALLARMPDALPFATHEWATAWWAHLRRDCWHTRDTLRVYVVRTTAGEVIAFAPYLRTVHRVLGLPLVRVVQPIGADPYLTEIRSMLVAPEHEAAVVGALSIHLRAERGHDWVRWGGLRHAGEAFTALAAHEGTVVDWQMSAFLLPLPASWDEFHRTRPRNVRESLRKCYNSLARDGHAWRFHALESGSEVGAALKRFFDLHGRRATAEGTVSHPDYFASPGARRFLADVVERMGRRGAARMFQLEIGGEVVAMRLGFHLGDTLYLYYSGYDPAWGKYSVMTTVVAETLRDAIARGVRVVNLSSGTDVSKTRWRPDEVAYADAVVVSDGVRARLAYRGFTASAAWAARRRTARHVMTAHV